MLQFRSPNLDMPYTCFNSEANFHFAQYPGCIYEGKSTGQVGGPIQNVKLVKKVSGGQMAQKI